MSNKLEDKKPVGNEPEVRREIEPELLGDQEAEDHLRAIVQYMSKEYFDRIEKMPQPVLICSKFSFAFQTGEMEIRRDGSIKIFPTTVQITRKPS